MLNLIVWTGHFNGETDMSGWGHGKDGSVLTKKSFFCKEKEERTQVSRNGQVRNILKEYIVVHRQGVGGEGMLGATSTPTSINHMAMVTR